MTTQQSYKSVLNINQQINWLLRDKYRNKITLAAKKEIARLRQGEPLDYIIGWKEFLGCKIDLSLRPLIPRPETEFWVEQTIKSIKKQRHCEEPLDCARGKLGATWQSQSMNYLRIRDCHTCAPKRSSARRHASALEASVRNDKLICLDLFSGSGCIGIAILKHIPQTKIDFADIDKNCLKQIKINLKLNKISTTKYRVVQTNIFNPVLQTTRLRLELRRGKTNYKSKMVGTSEPLKAYDYIFANPPYISLKNKSKLQKSVLKYEPHRALFAKQNDLYFIDQTLRQAKKYLRPNGQLFLEFSPEQKNAITVLLKKYQYTKWRFNKDQFNRWRWLIVKMNYIPKPFLSVDPSIA